MLGSFSRSPLQAHTRDPNGHSQVSPEQGTPPSSHRPTPINLKPLSATVVALIHFISHLNIKICKLLSLKLQINQIRVVFSHLKLWVKVVRHNSKCVKI